MDDFEKQLQRQPMRQIPAAWRADILSAAQAFGPGVKTRNEEPTGWAWLFARFPVAWGALAMLWTTIIGVNLLLSTPASRTTTHPVFARGVEPMAVWSLQRAELSLLIDGPEETTEHQPVVPLRPRSDRRREEGHGASLAGPLGDYLV